MSRKIWQGDVLIFIRKRMPGNQNRVFLNIYERITGAPLAPARISEILNAEKRGRNGRLGREEFAGKEDLFYQEFFEGKDLSVICSQLKDFLIIEDLTISEEELVEEESSRKFIYRFLRYGLSNLYAPEEDRNLHEVTPTQETDDQGEVSSETFQSGKKQDMFTSDRQQPGGFSQIFASNWFDLFLIFLATVVTAMYMTAKEISMTDLLLLFFRLKRASFAILVLSTATVPKLLGMLEAVLLYLSAKKEMGGRPDFLTVSKFGFENEAAKKRGVFDFGLINLRYGLMSNIIGALTCIALYIYATNLDGLTYYMDNHPLDLHLFLIFISSTVLSINWDYTMQKHPFPPKGDMVAENPDHYQLTHLHVLTTMLHQIFTISFVFGTVLYLFWYGYSERLTKTNLNPSFVYVIIFGMFYLWFASKSPYAKTLKVDCDWMIHLMPAFAGIIVWYVLWLYAFSGITYVCLLICAVSLWVWRCETTRHWVLFPDINHHRLE